MHGSLDQADPDARLVAGVMGGTSMDGLDAVAAVVRGRGLGIRASIRAHAAIGLGPLGPELRALAEGAPATARRIAELAASLGRLHVEVLERALDGALPDLVAAHGQTVVHRPPHSWQLLDAGPIAQRFACPVVYDLRRADLAAGGQGAPITPLADWILFRSPVARRAIVNLGGFSNVTILPAGRAADPGDSIASAEEIEEVAGFDVCACNQVLDGVARAVLGAPFDAEGAAASRGRADARAANELASMLAAQRDGGRSLGTGDECRAWIERSADRLAADDLAASAAAAIGRVIGGTVARAGADEVVLAGGGARHAGLVAAIESAAGRPVVTTASLGVGVQAREALAIAVLGALSADGVPITLPRVTGCARPAPLAGAWIGRGPLTGNRRGGAGVSRSQAGRR